MRPDATLTFSKGSVPYQAPLSLSSQDFEAYALWRGTRASYFVTGHRAAGKGSGTILTGLVGRGDLQGDWRDRSWAVGRRQRAGLRESNWCLDWRRTNFYTYGQGYAGLWPGLSADVYALRAQVALTTVALRYGWRRPWRGPWQQAYGLSLQRSQATADLDIRASQGLGRDPQRLVDFHLPRPVLDLFALTAGIVYHGRGLQGALTYTGAVGRSHGFAQERPSAASTGLRRRLSTSPFLTGYLQYDF
jgi:hypothetical protein